MKDQRKLRRLLVAGMLLAAMLASATMLAAAGPSAALSSTTQFYVPKPIDGALIQIAKLTAQGHKADANLITHAPNFSIGVAALRRAAMVLGGALARFPEFEPAIVERHHSAKRDAPSGTARAIAASVGVGRAAGEEIPIVSLRHGGQPGEHVLVFE